MAEFQGGEMEVIKGGRDRLERELARELFKPADNYEKIEVVIRRLAPRGKLQLQTLSKECGK